jgi:hypothetical protein
MPPNTAKLFAVPFIHLISTDTALDVARPKPLEVSISQNLLNLL